ncbi:hypothetical protein [Vibrio mediterranei]|uniref:hypothetical protein n=1 Tax=Vibrio mediterranei TaxID=689 RepID=UPI004067A235
MFEHVDELYESLCPELIDEFWEIYTKQYGPDSALYVDTHDMDVDDKIEIAWRMIATYPMIEKRLVND